jgi:hypothetical protein
MIKLSTGLRNALLVTGSLRGALANSEIRLYSGPEPSTADEALGGSNVLLCTIKPATGNFNFDSTAANGVVTKVPSDVLTGTNVASGTATFYRHVLPADAGTASSTAVRIQGNIGLAGTDMELSDTNLVNGAIQKLDYYSFSMLAQ